MNYSKYIYFLAAILLFLIIITSQPDSYFRHGDENGYLYNLVLLEKYGWTKEFFAHYRGMAGPLHSMIHWLLKPFTGAVPPFVRVPNFIFLIFNVLIINDLCKKNAVEIFAIPMTFVCVGFAMTELPAMFFLMLSIWLLNRVGEESQKLSFLKIAAAGICFSLSILGRMNFLALLPVISIWLFLNLNNWNQKLESIEKIDLKNLQNLFFKNDKSLFIVFSKILIFNILSLTSVWFLYQVWGGITSPETQIYNQNVAEKSWAIDHFILALCFAFMMCLVVSPFWFRVVKEAIMKNKKAFLSFFLLIMIVNTMTNLVDFLPAKSVFYRFTNESQQVFLSKVFGSFTILVAAIFILQLFLKIKENWKDLNYVFYSFAAFALLFTTIKMTHLFSARYPYLALPFLILMIKKEEENENNWKVILAILGTGIGILTWFSYQTIYPEL